VKTLIFSAAVYAALSSGCAFAQTQTGPGVTAPSGSSSMKMSRTDCDAAFMKLDGANTGSVSQAQVKALISDFKAADTDGDGKLSQMEFRQACDKGLVNSSATTGAGTGTNAGAAGSGPSPPLPK
jgi:hypothetical protein